MDLRNKWFVKQLSTQQFSGGQFTAEKRGHFAVEWWGHLRAELVGHYPRILQLLQLVLWRQRILLHSVEHRGALHLVVQDA